MRRFLLHVLPSGFHRIRHYGLIANNARREKLALARELLQVAPAAVVEPKLADECAEPVRPSFVCTHCGSVLDLDMESLSHINEIAGAGFDGKITGHITYFYGTCPDCTKLEQYS